MEGIEIEMQPQRTLGLHFQVSHLAEELGVAQRTLRSKERENGRLMRAIMYLRNRLSRCGSLLLNSEANCEKEARRAAIAEAGLKQLSLNHALAQEHADSLNLLSKFNTNSNNTVDAKTTIAPYNYNNIPTPDQHQEKQQEYDEPSLQEQQLQQQVAALQTRLEDAFSTPTDQQTFHSSDVAQLQQRIATCEAKLRSKTTDYDAVKAECDLFREQLNVADVSLQQMTDAYVEASQKAEKLRKEMELKEEVQKKLRAELLMEQQQHTRTQHELQMMASSPSPSAASSPGRWRASFGEEERKEEEGILESHQYGGNLVPASELLDLQHQLADRDAHIAKLLAVIEEMRQGLEGELETMHGKTLEAGGLRLMKAMLEQERVSRQQLLDAYTDSKKRIKALTVQLDEARKEVRVEGGEKGR